jgi:hypothetical protein
VHRSGRSSSNSVTGEDVCGLCIAPGGVVTLKHTLVVSNFVSTNNDNIRGTVTYG